MKLCVLGNSHVSSLKTAWDILHPHWAGIDLVFFASRGDGLQGLELQGDRLVPGFDELAKVLAHTSGGDGSVNLGDYDAFVLYGLSFTLPPLHACYSAAVRRQISLDVFEQSLSRRLLRQIRAGSSKPVFVGHNPLYAQLEPSADEGKNCMDYRLAIAWLNQSLAAENAAVVTQPAVTIVDAWHTDRMFSKGSTRLDVGDFFSGRPHADIDVKHMNGEFGQHWLAALFEEMRTRGALPRV